MGYPNLRCCWFCQGLAEPQYGRDVEYIGQDSKSSKQHSITRYVCYKCLPKEGKDK
jgi:hypothetical protein